MSVGPCLPHRDAALRRSGARPGLLAPRTAQCDRAVRSGGRRLARIRRSNRSSNRRSACSPSMRSAAANQAAGRQAEAIRNSSPTRRPSARVKSAETAPANSGSRLEQQGGPEDVRRARGGHDEIGDVGRRVPGERELHAGHLPVGSRTSEPDRGSSGRVADGHGPSLSGAWDRLAGTDAQCSWPRARRSRCLDLGLIEAQPPVEPPSFA